jgi:hypothetical protein
MAISIKSGWIACKTTPRWLWGFAAVSVCFIAAKIIFFDHMPEIFRYAQETGMLFRDIAAAIIAAVVFFVISFQLPAVIEQQRIAPVVLYIIEGIASNIRGSFETLYRGIAGNLNAQIDPSSVTLAMVETVFKSMNPLGNSLFGRVLPHGGPVPWRTVILQTDAICLDYIGNLWRYARFIDPELALLISRLEYSEYTVQIKNLAQLTGLNIASFDYLAGGYFKRFRIAGELSQYATRLRNAYGIPLGSFVV